MHGSDCVTPGQLHLLSSSDALIEGHNGVMLFLSGGHEGKIAELHFAHTVIIPADGRSCEAVTGLSQNVMAPAQSP